VLLALHRVAIALTACEAFCSCFSSFLTALACTAAATLRSLLSTAWLVDTSRSSSCSFLQHQQYGVLYHLYQIQDGFDFFQNHAEYHIQCLQDVNS